MADFCLRRELVAQLGQGSRLALGHRQHVGAEGGQGFAGLVVVAGHRQAEAHAVGENRLMGVTQPGQQGGQDPLSPVRPLDTEQGRASLLGVLRDLGVDAIQAEIDLSPPRNPASADAEPIAIAVSDD